MLVEKVSENVTVLHSAAVAKSFSFSSYGSLPLTGINTGWSNLASFVGLTELMSKSTESWPTFPTDTAGYILETKHWIPKIKSEF